MESGLASSHFLMCSPQLDRSEMFTELYREEKKEAGDRSGQKDKKGKKYMGSCRLESVLIINRMEQFPRRALK